jgi:hypothetical protein
VRLPTPFSSGPGLVDGEENAGDVGHAAAVLTTLEEAARDDLAGADCGVPLRIPEPLAGAGVQDEP